MASESYPLNAKPEGLAVAKKGPKTKGFALVGNTKGINEQDGVFAIQPDSAAAVENLHRSKAGQFTVENQGNINFSAEIEGGERIDSLGWFKTDAGGSYFLAASNGKIKNINSSTGVVTGDVTTNNTAGNLVSFCPFKGYVYMAEESMAPLKWDGTTTSAMGAFPKTVGSDTYTKPKILGPFQNRVVACNFEGFPSTFGITDSLTGETITVTSTNAGDGLISQVNPGDGEELTAFYSYYSASQGEEVGVFFKSRGLYILSGNTPTTWQLTAVSSEYGCLNHQCVARVGNDLIFLDRNNIYNLTTAVQSGYIEPRILGGKRVQTTLASMNLTQTDKAWVKHMPWRQEVWFGIPTGSSSEVDTIIVYRYASDPLGVEVEPTWSVRKNINTTCGLVADERFYTGTTNGYMRRWFTTSQNNGVAIPWKYRYPFYAFDDGNISNKRIKYAHAWFRAQEDTTLTIKTRWRHSDKFTNVQTLSKTVTSADAEQYGVAIYGSSVYPDTGDGLKCIMFFPPGEGTQIQFEVSGSSPATGVEFLGITGLVEIGAPSTRYI